MKTCPECGADREGAVRFCPGCGLDYWRAAAGQPAHPQPPPVVMTAANPPRSRATGFIAAGIALLVVAGGAAVVMSGALPAGIPGGRTTPTVRQLTEEEALIHAFFRQVRSPDAAYAVSYEGTTAFSGIANPPTPIAITGEFRLHGDNWAGRETLVQDGETVFDADMAIVDDIGYLREAGASWLSGEIPDRLQPISPFRRISTVTEVEYVEERRGDGVPQHSLLITKWLGGRDYSGLLRGARMESQVSRMEVIVDNFGRPIRSDLEMTVVATDGIDTLTISAVVTYLISDWEDVDPIVAPTVTDASAGRSTLH